MERHDRTKIGGLLSEVFKIDADEVTDDTAPENVALWDSLNHLRMATAIEELFGIRLTMKEIRSMISFEKIVEVVENHDRGKDISLK